MRTLPFQQSSRLLPTRQRTCRICLQFQIKRYNSSIPSTPQETPKPCSSVSQNSDVTEPPLTPYLRPRHKGSKRPATHLRNTGSYLATTPIFYVNGGTILPRLQ